MSFTLSPILLYRMSNKKMKETQTFQMVELYYVICALKGEAKAKPHLLKYFLQ